ncbi:MAG: hypothetical protein AB7I24_15940 [Candidatus Nanopelagicales bacterium]
MAADTRATAGVHIGEPPLKAAQHTTTSTSTEITERAGFLRRQARLLNDDVQDLHIDSRLNEWTERATKRVAEGPLDLLEHLSDLGFSWRDIARMVGVSVPAIQKWRRGGTVSGENRRGLANLVAACDLIREDYIVSDVASWFEMPLVKGTPITPIELYTQQQYPLLFDYASGHIDMEAAMNQLDPEWRQNYATEFEVFRAEDGQLSIRSKG